MLGELRQAIDAATFSLDSASLTEAHRLLDRLTAKVIEADIAFDQAQLWDLDDATSLRTWLQIHAKLTPRDAGATAKLVKWLAQVPATMKAWETGGLNGGQVQVIVAHLNDQRLPVYEQHEAALVAIVEPLSIPDTVKAMDQFAAMADALTGDGAVPDEPDSWLSLSRILDERGELRGSFDPVSTSVIDTALTVAERRDGDDEKRSPRQRRADALVDISRFYLDHHDRPTRRRHRPHVNLIISLEDLHAGRAGETIDGITVAHPDFATWICDSMLHRVVMAEGEVLDYGTAVHTVPAPLFQAVATRDRHCRWPGCDRKAKYCDAHHLHEFHRGGRTALDNIALFCGRHHRKLHRPGCHAKLLPGGTLEITRPDGTTLTSHPPRAGPPFEVS